MIVTIDGPAGAGKSHVARALAERLGFRFLDTGAMYRTVALAAIRQQVRWDDDERLAELASKLSLEMKDRRVLLDGEDVTDEIRATTVTSVIHHVADHPQVRKHLVELQRQFAADHDMITEGRDQGTVVFPDADCKIFLTASPEERAKRRLRDLQTRGETIGFEQVLTEQNDRDRHNTERPVGKLMKADDAVEVVTDDMTPEQVVDRLMQIVRQRQNEQ